jgi:predicted CDP-diglyceride synthetase/phosphatidate cytidylyltransferase
VPINRRDELINKKIRSNWSIALIFEKSLCMQDILLIVFQLYIGENKLHVDEMMMLMTSVLNKTSTPSWIFIALDHWNHSPRIDMSLYSDTLFWFRANQSFLLLLSAECLSEKQQRQNVYIVFGLTQPGLPRSIALEMCTLTITPQCCSSRIYVNFLFLNKESE